MRVTLDQLQITPEVQDEVTRVLTVLHDLGQKDVRLARSDTLVVILALDIFLNDLVKKYNHDSDTSLN